MMKSSGLSTESLWTPTFTSNSSLYPSPTRTRLHALAYISHLTITSRTIHSSTQIASVVPLPGTKPNWESSTDTVWWGRPQSSPGLSWPAMSAWDRGSFPFPMHLLVETDNETLLPVRGYLAMQFTSNNTISFFSFQRIKHFILYRKSVTHLPFFSIISIRFSTELLSP